MTLTEAQAACEAVIGLTWAEQYPLPLPLRVELWDLVRHCNAADRAKVVANFRGDERAAHAAPQGGHQDG